MKNVIPAREIALAGFKLSCPVLLAPMSGVSDLPFRQLATRFGASLVVSEMIASADLVRGRLDVQRRALGDGISPFAIQLAGTDPHWMAEAARLSQDLGADIIDINMGCPAKEVTGKQSGSALMRDLPLATSLIEAVVNACNRPVTLKMRLGWDAKSMNAPELARLAEASGVQMITVHGRTRQQFFKDRANWQHVRAVKERVTIPVVVNGDISSTDEMQTALAQSGADGVMVGRGAYGAPWLPGRLATFWRTGDDLGAPSRSEIAHIAAEHVHAMLSHYGTTKGLRNARKHIAWYLTQVRRDAAEIKHWRQKLCTEENPKRVLSGMADYFSTGGAVA